MYSILNSILNRRHAGEDAFAVVDLHQAQETATKRTIMAVADGVHAWTKQGIDAGSEIASTRIHITPNPIAYTPP